MKKLERSRTTWRALSYGPGRLSSIKGKEVGDSSVDAPIFWSVLSSRYGKRFVIVEVFGK